MDIAFDIYRLHWAHENNTLRKLRYARHFTEYFEHNCSDADIYSLRSESTPEGLFEVLNYVKDWMLIPFGYSSTFWCLSQTKNHQRFRLHTQKNLEPVVLTKNVYSLLIDSTTIHKVRRDFWNDTRS